MAILALFAGGFLGCGEEASAPASPAHQVPGEFVFIRDPIGAFPAGERTRAEEALQAIAERTGVYGVVVTAMEIPDPPAVTTPIFEEVATAGGQLLVALCTPDACDLRTPSAYSSTLSGPVEAVAPVPEPAVGNPDVDTNRSPLRWVEFVGAVATLSN